MLAEPMRIKMSIKALKSEGFSKEDLDNLKELGKDGIDNAINALAT